MPYNFDPELAAAAAEFPPLVIDDIAAARAGLDAMVAAANADADVSRLTLEDLHIAGPDGAPPVKIRVYRPQHSPAPTAALLYIHGGGFMVGSIASEHANAAQLADQLGIVAVSVDYRLAPESPFPAGLEDCYAALCWLHANAQRLGVDADRIGVLGQSAGGGLAAGLALLARDRKGPALCFQFLGIPELDDRLHTASMRAFTDTPLWNRPNAVLSWQAYLGGKYQPGGDDVPVYAAPARATELRGLPPAYISAMEFDPLRDEAIVYGLKLLEAGVAVELHAFPGTFHGSSLIAQAAVSQRQAREMLEVLRRALRLEVA
jgi:acetyl esterase/lipase